MPSSKEFDVFLSHHSVDKPWVNNLKSALESHGLSVWLDKDEIRPGDLFAEALETGLLSCKSMILIVSPEAMKSDWVKNEYYRALGIAAQEKHDFRLIPVILRTAELPGFLSDRHWVDFRNEDDFYKNLDLLLYGITGEKQKSAEVIEIPFVVAAMTSEQAAVLFENKIKKNPSFVQFKKKLFAQVALDHTNVYGKSPDDWKFPFNSQNKFSLIIWQTLMDLNVKLHEISVSSILVPKFVSEDFFSDKYETYTKTWGELKNSGCVLVVDAISLFHPEIITRLNDFHIESNDNIAMVVISPIDTYSYPITKMIEDEIHDHLQMAFVKYDTNLDGQCEFEIGNIRGFKRWAFTALPNLVDEIMRQKSKPSNREYIRKKMGMPKGVDELIFGTGGVQ